MCKQKTKQYIYLFIIGIPTFEVVRRTADGNRSGNSVVEWFNVNNASQIFAYITRADAQLSGNTKLAVRAPSS